MKQSAALTNAGEIGYSVQSNGDAQHAVPEKFGPEFTNEVRGNNVRKK